MINFVYSPIPGGTGLALLGLFGAAYDGVEEAKKSGEKVMVEVQGKWRNYRAITTQGSTAYRPALYSSTAHHVEIDELSRKIAPHRDQ